MNACEVLTQFAVSFLSLLPTTPFLWFSPGAFLVPCSSSMLNFVYALNKLCFTETRWHLLWPEESQGLAATLALGRAAARKRKG